MVIEAFDGSLYVNILDTLYLMEEVPEHERFSKEFDNEMVAIFIGIIMYVVAVLLRKGGF